MADRQTIATATIPSCRRRRRSLKWAPTRPCFYGAPNAYDGHGIHGVYMLMQAVAREALEYVCVCVSKTQNRLIARVRGPRS